MKENEAVSETHEGRDRGKRSLAALRLQFRVFQVSLLLFFLSFFLSFFFLLISQRFFFTGTIGRVRKMEKKRRNQKISYCSVTLMQSLYKHW